MPNTEGSVRHAARGGFGILIALLLLCAGAVHAETRIVEQTLTTVSVLQDASDYPAQTFTAPFNETIRSIAIADNGCGGSVSDGAVFFTTFPIKTQIAGGWLYSGNTFPVGAGGQYYLFSGCNNGAGNFRGTTQDSYVGGEAGHMAIPGFFTPINFHSNSSSGNALSDWAFAVCSTDDCSLTPPAPPTPTTTPPCTPGPDCASNVLFLPGIEASRLYDSNNNEVWIPASDGAADSLAMDTNGVSVNPDITTQDVIDETHAQQAFHNVYKSFLAEMRSWQTSLHIVATTTPYDWRLDYQTILVNGRKLSNGHIAYLQQPEAGHDPYIIETLRQLASTSPTGKVTIIAHSNGGLLAKALMQKIGDAQTSQIIDKVIFVDVPQVGTPQAIGALLHGFDQSIPFAISEVEARKVAQNMKMAYNLLPSAGYFRSVITPVVTFDPVTMGDWKTAFEDPSLMGFGVHSSDRLSSFMTDPTNLRPTPSLSDTATPSRVSAPLLAGAAPVHDSLDNWVPPAGVQLFLIAGWGSPTIAGVHYARLPGYDCSFDSVTPSLFQPTRCSTTTHISYTPNMVIDGDGTVLEPSQLWANGASSTRYWVDLSVSGYNASNKKTLDGRLLSTSHADILEVPQLHALLKSIEMGTATNQLPPDFISTAQPLSTSPSRLYFFLHSPLTLGFVDGSGNYTGSTANTTVFNVPDVEYRRVGEVQWLSIPETLAGQVVMRGVGTGSFTLDLERVNGSQILATTTFIAVPSSTTTVATLNVNPSVSTIASSTLSVDFNGDGVTDTSLRSSEGTKVVFKIPLTVTANNQTMVLHSRTLPVLTASLSGFVAGDMATSTAVMGSAKCTTTATATSSVGTYPIICTVGTLTSDKYAFATFVAGSLRVVYRCDVFQDPINSHGHEVKDRDDDSGERDDVRNTPSVFKSDSTISVKFGFLDANNVAVAPTTSPLWLLPQKGSTMNSPVDESLYTDPTDLGTTYVANGNQYRYNWKPKGLAPGSWYRVYAKLGNGQMCSATVGLR